jgi:hypothetical protein
MTFRNVARRGRVVRWLAVVGLVAAASAVGAYSTPASAAAAPRWASAGDAKIHPGVALNSDGGQCTANFVYTNGDTVYIGAAAHCVGKGAANETDGCKSDSNPLGTKVKIDGASRDGVLAYSSWLTMKALKEDNADLCAYNDFALIEIDPADVGKVNPSIPKFGGPTGLRTEGLSAGAKVYTFGNSDLRQGIKLLSPKTGVSLGDSGGGRTHQVTTVTPGIPGDSGSGFLDADGSAFGVLSTLSLTPIPGANGVTDLAKAMDYAREHAGENGDKLDDLQLVNGTEGFKSGLGLGII